MPYIGEVRLFAGNFPPQGWAFCNGQLLAISSNTALFSVLGTRFGGNGTTTFALPDFRGRVPAGRGQGPGLTQRFVGQSFGAETHTLTLNELPAHTHAVQASTANGTSSRPTGAVHARAAAVIPHYAAAPDASLAAGAVASAGSGLPHWNMQPYLCVSYIIALQGEFPTHP